jgi:hypothetical protein
MSVASTVRAASEEQVLRAVASLGRPARGFGLLAIVVGVRFHRA